MLERGAEFEKLSDSLLSWDLSTLLGGTPMNVANTSSANKSLM
jgi:hypothetical protein